MSTDEPRSILAELRQERGWSLEDLAKRVRSSRQMMSKLERGERKLSLEWLTRFSQVFGVPVPELIARKGAILKEHYAENPIINTIGDTVVSINGAVYYSIGRYDVTFSAGQGSLLEAHPEPLGFHLIEEQWLRGITSTAPQHLAVVRVASDSMERTLFPGDWVLVDLSQRRFTREGLYCIGVQEEGWVKRLSLNIRQKLIRVISDNPTYPLQELPEEDVRFIGRVLGLVLRRL